jgi:hypothetical protein
MVTAAGGCTNVIVGSGLTFSGGTLSASGSSGITQLTGAVTAGPGSGSQAATLSANAVGTSNIANSAVTLAKIQNAAANSKLLGSGAAGSGSAYAELTLGTNLSMSGTTLNATGAVRLAAQAGNSRLIRRAHCRRDHRRNTGQQLCTLDTASTVVAGTTQTVTAGLWKAGTVFRVTTAAQTLTLPVSSTLSTNGGIAIQTIGQSVTLAPNASDSINGGTAGASITIASGLTAFITTDGAGNISASPTTNSGSGTVTTSGSPASGNLAKFSGSTVVTSGDLSGDCVTSGTLAVTCALKVTPLAPGSGSASVSAPRAYYVCTTTCTITVPVPAAGYEFCILNDDNVSTVITLAAIGSSARYENTARTAYGTAGTGTFVSGGAVGDKICIVGRDSTHYLTVSYNGTWTAN